MKTLLRALFFIVTITAATFVTAQGIGVGQEQVTLEVRPNIIQPLKPVNMELISYNTDLNRARIAFYVDGVLISQAIGQTSYTTDAPAVGANKAVRFVIETVRDGTITKELIITPAQVDLLAEAIDSYAPVLYAGKKLPAHESAVLVTAVPYFVDLAGRKINPDSLVYSWYVDDRKQVAASGYGRQSFVFPGSALYRTKEISVQVETVDSTRAAERAIELPAYDPVVRFYQKNPLWGLDMSQAITAERQFFLEVPELQIQSVPFFFAENNASTDLQYNWRMNGSPMQTFGDRNVINLRAPDDQSGQARISLKIDNKNELLQIAESVFTVIFGSDDTRTPTTSNEAQQQDGPNFFGF